MDPTGASISYLFHHIETNTNNWNEISSLKKGEIVVDSSKKPEDLQIQEGSRFKKINSDSYLGSVSRIIGGIFKKDIASWDTEKLKKPLQLESNSTIFHVQALETKLLNTPNLSQEVVKQALESLDHLKTALQEASNKGFEALLQTYHEKNYAQTNSNSNPVEDFLRTERTHLTEVVAPIIDNAILNLGKKLQEQVSKQKSSEKQDIPASQNQDEVFELNAAFQNAQLDAIQGNSNSNSNKLTFIDQDIDVKLDSAKEAAKKTFGEDFVNNVFISPLAILRQIIQPGKKDNALQLMITDSGREVSIPSAFKKDLNRQLIKINGKEEFNPNKSSYLNPGKVWTSLVNACSVNRTLKEADRVAERLARIAHQVVYADLSQKASTIGLNQGVMRSSMDLEKSIDITIQEDKAVITANICFGFQNLETGDNMDEFLIIKRIIEIPLNDLLVSENDLEHHPLPGATVTDLYSEPIYNAAFAKSLLSSF